MPISAPVACACHNAISHARHAVLLPLPQGACFCVPVEMPAIEAFGFMYRDHKSSLGLANAVRAHLLHACCACCASAAYMCDVSECVLLRVCARGCGRPLQAA